MDLVDENFTELKGEIAGPPDTPYEGERGGYRRSTSVLRDIQASDCNFIFKGVSPTGLFKVLFIQNNID